MEEAALNNPAAHQSLTIIQRLGSSILLLVAF
jgi:hypothetical protein